MKLKFEACPEEGVIRCHRTPEDGEQMDPQRTITYKEGGITPHKFGLTQDQWDEWCAAADIMGWPHVWVGFLKP